MKKFFKKSFVMLAMSSLAVFFNSAQASETQKISGYTVGCFSDGDKYFSEIAEIPSYLNLCSKKNVDLVLTEAKKAQPNFGGEYKALKITPHKNRKDYAVVVFVNEKRKTIQLDDRVYTANKGNLGALRTRKDSFLICFDSEDGVTASHETDNQDFAKCSYATNADNRQIYTMPLAENRAERLGMKPLSPNYAPETNKQFVLETIEDNEIMGFKPIPTFNLVVKVK